MTRGAPLLALALLGACAAPADEPVWTWDLPPGFPAPQVPAENPMSAAKVELGRRLFYDPVLSVDERTSCASCHDPSLAFTDGRALPVGALDTPGVRSAPSLANVAYLPTLTWANPLIVTLEHQALLPLFGEEPIELGMAGREDELAARLGADPDYPARFAEAFGEEPDPFRFGRVVDALAAFQRTLISGRSAHDRDRAGEPDAMSEAARRGRALFESDRLGCAGCHEGLTLGAADGRTHQTGLYDLDGDGAYPAPNRGVYEVSFAPEDMGRFRAAPLRNIAVTAPYMHDGSIPTLDGVIDHYAAGGRARSARTSPRLTGFTLTDAERADLIAFLESLTDETFLADPRFADPFAEPPREP